MMEVMSTALCKSLEFSSFNTLLVKKSDFLVSLELFSFNSATFLNPFSTHFCFQFSTFFFFCFVFTI